MKAAASVLVAASVMLHACFARWVVSQCVRPRSAPSGVDFNTIFSSFPHLKRLYGLSGLSGNIKHPLLLFSLQLLAVLIHTYRRGLVLRDCLFSAPALLIQTTSLFYNSNLWRSTVTSSHPAVALTELASDCSAGRYRSPSNCPLPTDAQLGSFQCESASSEQQSMSVNSLQRRSRALEICLYGLTLWELHQRVVLPLAAHWQRHTHAGSVIAEGVAAVCKSARILQAMAGTGIVASYIVCVSAHLRCQIQNEKSRMQLAWQQFYDDRPITFYGEKYVAVVNRLKRLGAHKEQEQDEGLLLRDISQQWYTLDYLFGSVAVLSISLVLPSFTAFGKHIREAVMQKHWDRVITPMIVGDTYIAQAIRLVGIAILAVHQSWSLRRLNRTFSQQLEYQKWQLLTVTATLPDCECFRASALLQLLEAAHKNLITWDIQLRVVQVGKLLSKAVMHATRVTIAGIVIIKGTSSIRGAFPKGFIDTPLRGFIVPHRSFT